MSESLPTVYLARHGETAWTISRQHTGRTDLPLTARGEDDAWGLHDRLRGLIFDRVFVSPLRRARQTSLLAGFGEEAVTVADLTEWDYGEYEGLTTAEIRRERPGWSLFRHGCPGGESVAAVGARADRVIARLRAMPGRILVFGHGPFFGVLAARWVGLPPGEARRFVLGTAALSILGCEHGPEDPTIRLWNDDGHAVPSRPGGTQKTRTSLVDDRPGFEGARSIVPDRTVSFHGVARPPERPAPIACAPEMRR